MIDSKKLSLLFLPFILITLFFLPIVSMSINFPYVYSLSLLTGKNDYEPEFVAKAMFSVTTHLATLGVVDVHEAFDEKERQHFYDISNLMKYYLLLLLISIIGLLILFKQEYSFKKKMFTGFSYFYLALSLTVIFVGALFFDVFFHYFHVVLFPPNSWLFSYDSMIIKLFSYEFFIASGAIFFITNSLAGLLLLRTAKKY